MREDYKHLESTTNLIAVYAMKHSSTFIHDVCGSPNIGAMG